MADERSKGFDILMMVLLVGSIALVFVYEALDPVRSATARTALLWVDLALVVLFFVEWAWRIQASPMANWRYALRNSWELLGMVPLMLPLPAFLRALRILRVVRLLRVFGTLGKTIGAWERIAQRSGIKKIGIAAGVVTIGGAVIVWALEKDTNARLASLPEAMWWAVVTVTTVGYGDITPQTTMGRFVATILMVTGIGIIGLLASTLASVLVEEDEAQDAAQDLPQSLQRLARLHDKGKLSDEQYERAKELLLA